MSNYVKNLSLLTAKFIENELVDGDTGAYSPPVDGLIDLADYNVPVDLNQSLPGLGSTPTLPVIEPSTTLNLNTGSVDGLSGSVDNVNKITKLITEILSIHQALLDENNTTTVYTGFTITKE